MLTKVHKAKGKGSCVILVDEIMKTEQLGVGFANKTRLWRWPPLVQRTSKGTIGYNRIVVSYIS